MNRAIKAAGSFVIVMLSVEIASVGLAVTSSVNITITDPNQNALKITSLTLTPQETETATEDKEKKKGGLIVMNDDHDNQVTVPDLESGTTYDVTAEDENGKKYKGVLVVPAGGGTQNLSLEMERAGLTDLQKIGIGAGAAAAGLIIVNQGGGDNNGTGGGSGSTGGSSGGSGSGSTPTPMPTPTPTATNTNENVNCSATNNPQRSATFVFNELLHLWIITINPDAGAVSNAPARIVMKNGFVLTGTLQGSQLTASGHGQLTGVNTTVSFNGTFDVDTGALQGNLQAGPPLGGGPNDEVGASCNGTPQ